VLFEEVEDVLGADDGPFRNQPVVFVSQRPATTDGPHGSPMRGPGGLARTTANPSRFSFGSGLTRPPLRKWTSCASSLPATSKRREPVEEGQRERLVFGHRAYPGRRPAPTNDGASMLSVTSRGADVRQPALIGSVVLAVDSGGGQRRIST
jgi:hypothetical protein